MPPVGAAAWIQFENHNWFFHGRGTNEDTIEVPLAENDDWHEDPMYVRRTVTPGDGAAEDSYRLT